MSRGGECRKGDVPRIVIGERVALEVDEGLRSSGRLGARSSDGRDSGFVVLSPLDVAAGF